MDNKHYTLVGLWIAYCIVHSLLADIRLKNGLQRIMGSSFKYYRIAYSLFAAITLALLLYFQFTISSPLLFSTWMRIPPALILLLPGVIIMSISIYEYFYELSGLQAIRESVPEQTLQQKGLHKYTRHPLYLGTLMFVWGLFLWQPLLAHLLACTIITIYVLIGIELEEKKLYMEYGNAYKVYSSKVPKLIPRLRSSFNPQICRTCHASQSDPNSDNTEYL
jgi:methanethiol S-methyltransferase